MYVTSSSRKAVRYRIFIGDMKKKVIHILILGKRDNGLGAMGWVETVSNTFIAFMHLHFYKILYNDIHMIDVKNIS